ncbi:MAG: NAD-dependent epimerase/dehydratase family protein [Betaproteobacteria bacterium]|nr:NAD-dependent epimerase/dehydratase family protein [Betaproteobacteria bacterium]
MVIVAVWVRFAYIAACLAVRKLFFPGTGQAATAPLPALPVAAADRPPASLPGVVVTGATSQIGHFLIPRLRDAGYRVHAVSRRPPAAVCAAGDGVAWHQIDIAHDAKSMEQLVGAQVLIHLAPLGTLPPMMDTLVRMGVRRIVAFGSTSRYSKLASADPKEQTFVRELIHGEELLATKCPENGIAWTVFRPTLIYGCGMDKNVTTIANFIRRFHFFPIVGEGTGLRRPVHADDLAAACLAALDCPATRNRAYNLSGGETLTYRQMVEAIFAGLGKKPRIIRIPLAAYALLVKAASVLPGYRHLNPEMVARINLDLDFDHLAATRDFGFAPRKFEFPRSVDPHPGKRRDPATAGSS